MIITNKHKHDSILVKAVSSDYQYQDKRYSVTSILTEYREVILKRRHNDEIVNDVSDMAWMLFGTAFHEFLEKQEVKFETVSEEIYQVLSSKVKEKHILYIPEENHGIDTTAKYFIKPKIKEEHLIYKCERSNYTLTGYSDLYNILTNTVTDYKTTSVNKVLYANWDDYIKQLKLYAVMLNHMGYPCNQGKLIVFLKDWNKMSYKKDPKKYPPSPIYEISWEFSYETLKEEKEWIESYFEKMEEMEKLSDNNLPICSDKVRKFGRKSSYAVMKNQNKRAEKSKGVRDEPLSKEQAWEYIRYNGLDKDPKNKYWVEERKAEDSRCMEYCDSCHWCNFYIENYAEFILKDKEGKIIAGFKDLEEVKTYQENVANYKDLILEKIIKIEGENLDD